MVTTVGTEHSLKDLLSDLIQLDFDAASAYQAAIDRIENQSFRTSLSQFREDHLRHTRELGAILRAAGHAPPHEGDMKEMLTKGKVVIGGLMGDRAILRAMQTNEDDTVTAYERAVEFKDASPETRGTLEHACDDERRHRAWIVESLEKMD